MLKKISLLTIALLITVMSLSACSNKNEVNNEANNEVNNEVNKEEGNVTSENGSSVDENSAPGEENSNEQSESKTSQPLTDIINQIYAIKPSGLKTMELELNLADPDAVSYNTGLKDASKVKEAIVSEAMISAQAYSLVLVRVNDKNDTEAVAKEMLDGINPAKWVCVSGDDLQIVAADDLVLLIMVDSQLSDTVTSQEIVDAFSQVIGKDVEVKLSK